MFVWACLVVRRKWRLRILMAHWEKVVLVVFVVVLAVIYACGGFRQWTLICHKKPGQPLLFKWQIQQLATRRRFKELMYGAGRNHSDKDRLLCWVMTSPRTLKTKGTVVRDTWAQLCDLSLFMSSEEDLNFPALGLNVPEKYEALWMKAREAWLHVYERHLEQFEWFLKADDDTYVLVENLRTFLRQYDPAHAHYFGQRMHQHAKGRWWCEDDYNSGGAGYIVSREALRKLGPVLRDDALCSGHHSGEDVQFSLCLKSVGVTHADESRDDQSRQRFHLFSLTDHAFSLLPGWTRQRLFDEKAAGDSCCSGDSVSFHYVSPVQMWRTHYLIYCIWPRKRYGWWKTVKLKFCKQNRPGVLV